jgi:hypothetical protein
MRSDGLIELDQSCWSALAKYNLMLATLFAVLLLVVREADPAKTQLLLLVENGVLAVVFGAIQTYCWISRCGKRWPPESPRSVVLRLHFDRLRRKRVVRRPYNIVPRQ